MNVRLITTLIIWLVFAISLTMMVTLPSSGIFQASEVIVVTFILSLAVVAAISTLGVWGVLGHADDDAARRGKGKRSLASRVERLVDDLDDDEVYELEALLLNREDDARHGHDTY